LLCDAFDAVQGGDARGALLTVARCVEGGRDAGSFTRDLEGRARELLVVQTLGEVPPELSLTPEIDERLHAQAGRIGPAEVVRVLDLLGAALEAVRAGADPRTQLELALVKAATPRADGSTRALLARIERLEQALAGGAPPPAVSPVEMPLAVEMPEAAPVPTPSVEASEAPALPTHAIEVQEAPAAVPARAAEVADEPQETDEPQEAVAAPAAVVTLPASDLDSLWPAVHESVKAEHGLLGAVLNEAVPAVLTDTELTLAFAPSAAFLKRKAEDPANRAVMIDTLQRLTGRRYRISFELREDLAAQEQNGGVPTEEEIVARLVAELDAEELPEDWLRQEKGG
jgi:DNA polymerase III subunit gamma/tau